MSKYSTTSTSAYSATVNEPIVLSETSGTRRVFLAQINDAKVETGETVSGTIVHQRKGRNSDWENAEAINLATLKAGEGVKLKMGSEELKLFYDRLTEIYNLSSMGVQRGQNNYIVASEEDVITVPKERQAMIKQLLDQNYGEEVWQQLVETDPDLATHLSRARILEQREYALQEFKDRLNSGENESYWQKFFEENTWIFGFGLDYRFLSILQSQPHLSGVGLDGRNTVKGDLLLGDDRFTVLVELKTPNTRLFTARQDRSDSWGLSAPLISAVNQILVQKAKWLLKAETPNYGTDGMPITQKALDPKCLLIIGNCNEFRGDDRDSIIKAQTFELFRRDSRNIEIITFDELYRRAERLLSLETTKNTRSAYEQIVELQDDDDLPF